MLKNVDKMHRQKIDISDEILVINVNKVHSQKLIILKEMKKLLDN